MTATIQLTLDGTLINEHNEVSLRLLGRSMVYIQSAADRAFLEVKYGKVWKHAKLRRQYYEEADFIVGAPEEGSYIIKFASEKGRDIVKRLKEAISDPYKSAVEGAEEQLNQIARQIDNRRNQLQYGQVEPKTYRELLENPDEETTRTYGDRSISKEIDQLVSPVRKIDGSILKLSLKESYKEAAALYEFTPETARRFHRAISARQLGGPVIYKGYLRKLDRGHNQSSNFKGVFVNTESKKDVVLHIATREDYSALVPYLDKGEFVMLACPVIEYSSFDPMGGDLQFIEIVNNG